MKKGFILTPFLITLVFVSLGYFGYEKYKENTKNVGAPLSVRYERELTPVEDSKYYLGTSSPSLKAWRGLIVDEICLDSDCKTAWPTGGSGSGGGSWSTTTSTHTGRLINYPNNNTDIVTVGSNATTTAEVFFDPNIQSYRIGSSLTASTTILGNATTTGSLGAGAILVNGDYITDFTGTNLSVTNGVLSASGSSGTSNVSTSTNETSSRLAYWTSTNGTPALLADVATTTLTASAPLSLSQPVVKVGGSNSTLSLDTSGTWSGNAGTASALAANGANCSSGQAPLGVDTAGAVESCFDVWTEAENTSAGYSRFPFTVNTGYNSTTTILGFLNGFFSTASTTISSDFRLPSLTQGVTYIGSTGLVNTRATTSVACSGSVSCSTFDVLGSSPITITGTDSTASTTLLGDTNSWTGVNRFGNASSTYHSFGTASSTQWLGGGLTSCSNGTTDKLLYNSTTGQFSCGADQSGGGSGGGSWSTTTSQVAGQLINYPNNTSDIVVVGSNASTTAEVYFDPNSQKYQIGNSLTASTTIMGNATTTGSMGLGAIFLNSDYFTDLTGTGLAVSGGVLNTSNIPNASLQNSSITLNGSAVSLGGSLTVSSTTLLGDTNYFSAVNRFNFASSTYHSFDTASTTNLIINGENFNDLTGTGLAISGSALVTSNIPNASLANSTISGIALGSNLADLTATDSTLTFSGAYNGGTARTVGLNLGNANTWTVNQTFNYSSSTIYSSFLTASTTNLFLGTGQGALFTGSGQRVSVVATSTPTVTAPITYSGTLGQFLGGSSGTFDCTSANGSTKGCITSTDWTTFNNKLGSYDAWSHTLFGGQEGGNFYSATSSMMAIGTSTATNNLATLTVSSSTASQLSLSAGVGLAQWTLRNAGANLYFSTTTVAGISTSTPFLSILNSGNFLIGTTTPWLNSAFNLVGTSTISGNFSNLRASTTANTTQTIDWSAKQANGVASTYWDIMLTGNTNIVMNSTSSNPIDGAFYKIRVCQDGTGSRTLTWANPVSLRWGGKGTTTISSTANTCSFILFNYTATNGTGIYTGIASTTGAPIK